MNGMEQLVRDIEARYCKDGQGADRSPIFRRGKPYWYALRVVPQREDQAEAWLRLRGVYAFHPVLTRKAKRFGAMREYQRRYLPGYVFARFPGDPVVHAVTSGPFITGALCRSDGTWGALEPKKLRAIHQMRKVDAEADAARKAERARRRRQRLVGEGDSALFRSGPFSGFTCEVVELRASGGAMVRFSLFGRETSVEASTGDLVPLRKTG